MTNPALWFFDHGIGTFPIKPRDKVPACASWDDYRPGKTDVLSYGNYGVVLGPLGVLDSDSPEVEAWVAANAPKTPFVVETSRGLHRYYRLISAAPHYVHRDGHTIEFRNFGQYVVGPGSVHPSGHVYAARPWSWTMTDVPFFPVADFGWEDRPEGQRGSADGEPLALPPVILAGERHDLLFKLAKSLQARGVSDVEHLLAILKAENRAKCSPPVDERELERYIRRASRYKDRPGFTIVPCADGAALAGSLIDVGISVEAATVAANLYGFDPHAHAPAQVHEEPAPTEMQEIEFDESGLDVVDEKDLT